MAMTADVEENMKPNKVCKKCKKPFFTPYLYEQKCPDCYPKQPTKPHQVTFGHWTPPDYQGVIYD